MSTENRIVFFHGLESSSQSDKAKWLQKTYNAYCPDMDYKDPNLFQDMYNEIQRINPRMIIGSSMGGWFAYCMSTITGIRTLLYNPAFHSRSMDPKVTIGKTPAHHTVILGKLDDVIDPIQTKAWIRKNGIGTFDIRMENGMGHRSPLPLLQKYVEPAMNENTEFNQYVSLNIKDQLPSFNGFLMESEINELEIPSGRWVDIDLKKIDDIGMKGIWKMYTDSYSKEGLDLSAADWGEMQSKYKATFLKDVDTDGLPDAFIIYKPTPYGNKIALLGTNGLKDAKRDLIKKLLDLVHTKGWFIEASKKMEDLLSNSGCPVVRDEKAIMNIVGSDKEPEMMKDGYYQRYLSKASKKIVKRIYGILK